MNQLFIIYFFSLAVIATSDDANLEKLLHDGNNGFTAKMFSEVAKNNTGKSFVISAYSVLTPLAQLSLAAVGESHDELLSAIGMPDDQTTKEVFSMANAKLQSVKGITLKEASKIYVADAHKLNETFAATTKEIFKSEVQNINFGHAEKAAKEINTWVEEHTNNRIKDLVNPDNLGPTTDVVLVNAIFFKGTWKYQFNPEVTSEEDFHVNKNKAVKVQMMFSKRTYKYSENNNLDAQIIQIPYIGDESSLVVVLPRDIEGLTTLEEKLKDPNALDVALENMYSTEVELHLPKFKIETTTNLADVLPKIGVQKIFDPTDANLNYLLQDAVNLSVSSATQKAFIEVNEEGAEASAANEFGISFNSFIINKKPPPVFKADRPFHFVVKANNLSLFEGATTSP